MVPTAVQSGDEVELQLELSVPAPWHVFGDTPGPAGQPALKIEMKMPADVEAVSDWKWPEYETVFEGYEIHVYNAGDHLFRRKLKVKAGAKGAIALAAKLTYQACTPEFCAPLKVVELTAELQVRPEVSATTQPQTQEAADWQTLFEAQRGWFRDQAALDAYDKLSHNDRQKFQDDHERNVIRLAEEFWDKYPDSTHRIDALTMSLHANPEFNKSYPAESEALHRDWRVYLRSLPKDIDARLAWNQKSYQMVQTVLASPRYTAEQKEMAEWYFFGMNFRQYSEFFRVNYYKMNLPDEARIQREYWAGWDARLDAHLTKYADLEMAGKRASDFISALNTWSPAMAEANWRHLLEKGASDANGLLADKPAIKAARALALEQLAVVDMHAGIKPVDMKFTALDGREVDLSALRGKVVLVDFWAMWCEPCLAEVPNLRAMYEKYHDQGFEVVGISVDEEFMKQQLEKFLKDKGVKWPQRFEGKGAGADRYQQLYGVSGFPTQFLLDKQGKLVDKNARGERLEPLIQKYLSSNP